MSPLSLQAYTKVKGNSELRAIWEVSVMTLLASTGAIAALIEQSPVRKGRFRFDDLYDLLLSFANPQEAYCPSMGPPGWPCSLHS